MDWFHVAELEPGVDLVAEPGHVCSWLVHGADRSVLLDSGLGLASIRAAIAPVARTPVVLVNSHSDFDHVGGNAEFDERLIHEAGERLLAAGTPVEVLRAYDRLVREIHEDWQALAAADRAGFHLVGPDEVVRPWPPDGVEVEDWRIEPPPPTGVLREGDTLDLGDRTLRVLHTPGHTPDHVCLLDERAGILFAQDQAYYGAHLVYEEHSDIDAWARSARRLADEVSTAVRVVYVAHCLRPALPPRVLRELADAGEEVASGSARLEPGKGLLGEDVLAADYEHFSVLIPPVER